MKAAAAGAVLFQIFERPEFLRFFLAVPFIITIFIYHFCTRYPVIKKLLHRGGGAGIFGDDGLARSYILSCIFFLIFIICSIIAVASPRMGKRLVREYRRGTDIVLAMDVSRSMELRDVPVDAYWNDVNNMGAGRTPSRLERAGELAGMLVYASIEGGDTPAARALIPAEHHIRYALAIGKGRGYLAVPLTSDTEAVLSLLRSLSPSLITVRGTNLEELVLAASGAFDDTFAAAKVIVLFTDGESLDGSLSSAAEQVKEKGITLYTVGLGSAAGMEVLEGGGTGGMKITSSLQEGLLAAAASLADGAYIDGNEERARPLLLKIIEAGDGSSWNYREEAQSVWHLFLLAALAAFLLSKLCGKRPCFAAPPFAGTKKSLQISQ